jgi:hypothetical protein
VVCEITEDEFDAITGGAVMNEYVAIMAGSTAVAWLASDDRSVAGVVRRDRDGHEITYSWGCYFGDDYRGHGGELESEHAAQVACIRGMTSR